MKKVINIVLLLSLIVGFYSCDKEKGNGSGDFSGNERTAIISGMIANFADVTTKSNQDVVSKTTTKINDEYSLEVEVVGVSSVNDTKATVTATPFNDPVNVYEAKAYTVYSKAYTPSGRSKVKPQDLNFRDGSGSVVNDELQIPVNDKNCRILVFADVKVGGTNYPTLTNNDYDFSPMTVTTDPNLNLCYFVGKTTDFNEVGTTTLSLTPLFSQIRRLVVKDKTVIPAGATGTPENVELKSAAILEGAQGSATITIKTDNVPADEPTPVWAPVNTNTKVTLSTDTTKAVNFIPNGNDLKLELGLKVGSKDSTFTVPLTGIKAVKGHRYDIRLKVVKKPQDGHYIYLLTEHLYYWADEPDGLFDAYANYKDEGILGLTNPPSTPIEKNDGTTNGDPVKWNKDSTSYCNESRNEYVITCTRNPIYLKFVYFDPTLGAQPIEADDAKNVFAQDEVVPDDLNVFFRETKEIREYQVCIRKNEKTKGKRFVLRWIM